MNAATRDLSANPSSAHREGQRVRAAIDLARMQVARFVNASEDEVVFVSGGTEGDHLAIVGSALAQREAGRHVAFAAVEHHAVHGAAHLLHELGWTHSELPCDAEGRTLVNAIDALPVGTTVLSVMFANNETGVLQPIAELAARAHARGMRMHCDAVQGAGKVPLDVAVLGADYLVLSGHKFGGPKGAAALIVRKGAPLSPLSRGSAHERGRRGGTENVAGIIGLGLACDLALADLAAQSARIGALRARFESALRAAHPDCVIHGAGAERLPNTTNVSFPGARADHLLLALDARGVMASAGAACASGAVEPSPVLAAMRVPRELAIGALRFSLGAGTTEGDIDAALAIVSAAVGAARGAGVRA
jgi:cysteine desulfurase